MIDDALRQRLISWEAKYNDPAYFSEDPIAFPRIFAERMRKGTSGLKDVEIASVFAAHFAWGRRAMIVRDCNRLFDHMQWRPWDYVSSGEWKSTPESIHRTVKWCDVAAICRSLKEILEVDGTLEGLEKSDPKAPNKKINMMRRWLVRRDGKVDLGLWPGSDPAGLVIPLDVHVYDEALAAGLTTRSQKDIRTAMEITDAFREIWPEDPCRGDFALFGYGVTGGK